MRKGTLVNPPSEKGVPTEIELDFVGSIANAATVISSLHSGEKRLVFANSRSNLEELASALRLLGTETYVSHFSLAVNERRRAEQRPSPRPGTA